MLIYPDHITASDSTALNDASSSTVPALLRLTAVAWTMLIAVTWPLWGGETGIPRIPFHGWLCHVPVMVDHVLLGGVAAFLLTAALNPSAMLHRRWLIGAGAVLWMAVLAGDQLRLQPWAYQFLLILAMLSCLPARDVVWGWRWLVISIYVWSAVSKIDMAFVNGHGQMLLEGLLKGVGTSARFWSAESRQWAAAAMPAGEMLAATLLLFRRTRWWGWLTSCVLHGLLIIALGPRGLGHETGVLIWNAFFIVQNTLLFGTKELPRPAPRRFLPARVYAAAVMSVPALEQFGLYDHWPAWAVYCARPEQVRLKVAPEAIDSLPMTLRPFVQPPLPLQAERPVNYDGWIFSELHCPAYPQGRYRLALVRAIVEDSHIADGQFRVYMSSTPDRRTGRRETVEFGTRGEIDIVLDHFLINTSPQTNR